MNRTRTSLLQIPRRVPSQSARRRKRVYVTLRVIALGLFVVFFVGPILWMILTSFKETADVVDPSKIFVFSPTLDNFAKAISQQNFGLFAWNSLFVASAATGMSLVIGLPAAYAIARFRMMKSVAGILIARALPGISLLVPWYFIFFNLGLTNGYVALLLAHMFIALPLIVWILWSFFNNLPEELEEAAQVDGLTAIGAFARIAVPLARSGIATAVILSFIFSWNNFMFTLVLADSGATTLPVAVYNFIGYAAVDWGGLMAASLIVTMPIAIITLFTQKYIVSGLTGGATKG